MQGNDAPPLFLDTSILIASVAHCPGTKKRIRERLAKHGTTATSAVALQEWKRRLLKDAAYLLGVLAEEGTVTGVRWRINRLPTQQARKRNICEGLLNTVDVDDQEDDRAERLRLYLQQLLQMGVAFAKSTVSSVVEDSGCACAGTPVRKKGRREGVYDFGTDQCSKTPAGRCGIVSFLLGRREKARAILAHLAALDQSEKTDELKKAEAFLREVIESEASAAAKDPCLAVGDLLIALESCSHSHLYTMNYKESTHLCAALGQTLIVRPMNPAKDDELTPKAANANPPL